MSSSSERQRSEGELRSRSKDSGAKSDESEPKKHSTGSSFGDYSEWSEDPFVLFFKQKAQEK